MYAILYFALWYGQNIIFISNNYRVNRDIKKINSPQRREVRKDSKYASKVRYKKIS